MKKGALASGSLAVAGSAVGSAAAQEGQEDDEDALVNDQQMRCIMFQDDYRPESEFVITSPVLDWTPSVPANLGTPFNGYNTRVIRYRGTGENVLFFQRQDAEIPPFNEDVGYVVDDDQTFAEDEFTQPEVFSLWSEASFFEGTNRLVTARFSPVEEDFENQIFEEEDFEEDDWIF